MAYTITRYLAGKPAQATLIFMRSELLTDIAQLAKVEADAMKVDEEHDRHIITDIAEDGYVDRVTRVIALAVDECRELLYPYTRSKVEEDEYRDNHLTEDSVYIIDMGIDTEWATGTVSYLERLIHEYLVCKVMADWLSITKPTSAETWAAKAEQAKTDIISAVNYRRHTIRRPLRPF